jgi:hypothetical protein
MMATDDRTGTIYGIPTAEDRGWRIEESHPSSILNPLSSILRIVLTISAVLLALAACGVAPDDANRQDEPGGGSRYGPESVAEHFFKDLHDALKDPALADDTARGKWAEKLAEYFAPNERDDQRAALNTSLSSLVDGMGRLNANQTLTLDVRVTGVQKVSDDGDRALVRPVNGTANASIYLLIAHTNDRGVVIPEFEQEIGFDKIIGRSDGAIPTIRIGDRWYLTEG